MTLFRSLISLSFSIGRVQSRNFDVKSVHGVDSYSSKNYEMCLPWKTCDRTKRFLIIAKCVITTLRRDTGQIQFIFFIFSIMFRSPPMQISTIQGASITSIRCDSVRNLNVLYYFWICSMYFIYCRILKLFYTYKLNCVWPSWPLDNKLLAVKIELMNKEHKMKSKLRARNEIQFSPHWKN